MATQSYEKESPDLTKIKSRLWRSFLHISKKMELYEDDVTKYAKLATIQQKLAASLLNCLTNEVAASTEEDGNNFATILSKARALKNGEMKKQALMAIKNFLEVLEEEEPE
ncbi:MAG TPA: hypothetical protein VFF30_10240 [Nitrososphaerales archaeon]|nr:hypothetical protein [Nitrososphaerales archaeon]